MFTKSIATVLFKMSERPGNADYGRFLFSEAWIFGEKSVGLPDPRQLARVVTTKGLRPR